MENLFFSIIIAVYERPIELIELLQSLSKQTYKNFEVLVVDDGSKNPLEYITNDFSTLLTIRYLYKENSGPGLSRNYGMQQAKGEYFIFLDSDTIVPKDYLSTVNQELNEDYVDAFGGPDDADKSFNILQKAITFSMTSYLTTGGIRGGKKQVNRFQPRSFNMGISRKAYELTNGFSKLRVGEDPDLSMRIWEKGLQTRLFLGAKVLHKRRSTLKSFAKQVYQFGIARPILNQRHPNYIKISFWFPAVFLLANIIAFLLSFSSLFVQGFIKKILLLPLLFWMFYLVLILVFATKRFGSFMVGLMSIPTTLIQFYCYGFGFLEAQIKLNILQQKPEKAFPRHFYLK
ncbi:glycosyltransferase [Weeksella virosa]|uniref:glycosyltransferase n=1 Tax=Weeksella virosa TaxID=1014 RepID=UPI000DFB8087|nr:glycosyltransferase [Weeksella virosa]MDK7675161.1 glycosyltransferase [Weeksella virosa]SUP53005.1 Chondroitin polymerase [Weeksella virosa]